MFIQTYKDCFGTEYTTAELQRYADSYVFFSSYHDKIWGTTDESSGSGGSGTFLNAVSSITTRFVVETSEGAFGGGGSLNSLSTYSFNDQWDFFDADTHYSGFNRYLQVYGSNCDVTTP